MNYYQLENNRIEILKLLEERQEILSQLADEMKNGRGRRPPGKVRVTDCRNNSQYYWKRGKEDRWKYISKANLENVGKIMNYEYRTSLLQHAEKELRFIEKLRERSFPERFEADYEKLCKGQKELLSPIFPSTTDVINSFAEAEYEPFEKYDNNVYQTTKGELVRSKSEVMIAERLSFFNVPYQYEAPLYLEGYGTVRPDFKCLNVRTREIICWEHQGKMGSDDYASSALKKVTAYEDNGYFVGEKLIITSETGSWPLMTKTIDRWIKRLLL